MVQVKSRDDEEHGRSKTGGCERTIVMEGGRERSGYEGQGGRAEMYSPTGVLRPRSWRDLRAPKRVDFWSREEMMVSELTHERSRERQGHGVDKKEALAGWI
jgi:hypothetical protein